MAVRQDALPAMAKGRRRVRLTRKRSRRLWLWLSVVSGAAVSLGAAVMAFVIVTGIGIGIAVSVASSFLEDLPQVDEIASVGEKLFQTTTIRDRTGRTLGSLLGEGRRTVVAPENIPQVVKVAVIASEDATFYENPGVEVRAILRALWQNFRGGQVVSGASTITQQLVKNVLLTPEETYERKLREAVLAWQISQRFSKDEILGLYLNQNYYGSLAYGVVAAADTYFGKALGEITLAEAAMLAGILRAPSTDNPQVDPVAARREQLRVLAAIERHGLASIEQVVEAREENVAVKPTRQTTSPAPHFLEHVVRELQNRYGPEISRLGWDVTTTLDLELQAAAEARAREHVRSLSDRKVTNAAVVSMRPGTGEILAMVGSLNFNNPEIDGQVNVATALRQPGSAFKLFTYASALEQRYSPATMLLDIPTAIPIVGQEPYRPRNYDRAFRGPVSLRTALASSLNVPAVRTQVAAGVEATVTLAERMGISTLADRSRIGPSIALGSNEVRLIELTTAYATVANQGRRVSPTTILCVRDSQGRIVEQLGDGCAAAREVRPLTVSSMALAQRVISADVAYLLTSILSDSEARLQGFGEAGELLELDGRPAAVKTGTTENTRDALTVGFTPQFATGVWVGNADGSPMDDVTGVRGASPIWKKVMDYAHEGLDVREWKRPATIVVQEVDVVSGFLPSPFTPETREEEFMSGHVPTQRDVVHQPFRVHVATGLLATPDTPPDQVKEQIYVVLPIEAEAWQRSVKPDSPLRLPPDGFVGKSDLLGSEKGVLVTKPTEGAQIRSILEIVGSASIPGFVSAELELGEGVVPSRWNRIGDPVVEPRSGSSLGAIDTIQLPDGAYTLRLTVRAVDGGAEIALRRFTVDNTPPTVELLGRTPETSEVAGMVGLGARVTDAGGIARVEFLVDGESVGVRLRTPYTVEWASQPGEHRLVAVATDRAGNVGRTEPVTVRVR